MNWRFPLVLAAIGAAMLPGCGGNSPASHSVLPQTAQTRAQNSSALAAASVNWMVGTGASTISYAVQNLDFYPNTITIDAGDSITYSVASGFGGDAHTVAFVPPGHPVPSPDDPADLAPAGGTTVDGTTYVNSGILFGGQLFTLHFPKAGTYRILCLFHEPAMVGTVIVQKAGAAYPHSQAYYNSASASDRWADFAAGQRSVALFPFATGGTTVGAGIAPGLTSSAPPTQSTVLRFVDSSNASNSVIAREGSFTFKVNTTLTFENLSDNEPHTVTFAPPNAFFTMHPDPPVNAVAFPGVTLYDGSKIVNSGTLHKGDRFRIKFTKAGTYHYGCVYHFNSRMTGTITITP
ncbi:MAG TPA: plastocyanin/azurin family copper-binding protein [Candidatus Baltobacteraceae bacterium]|jgi:plastocyanin|nr:plastocyanin/azurin family copper-binding protein [Candidatus Baltobacteraceae bacterium]